MKLKRALLIGIDRYQTFQDLRGCSNDVKALAPLFEAHADGSNNFDCRALCSAESSEPLTTATLTQHMTELFRPGADVALLYFAGHAANVSDELYLVATDGSVDAPGVAMAAIFDLIFQSKVPEVVVVLDCCFAGHAGQVTDKYRQGALLRSGLSLLASSRADETSAEHDGRGFFSVLLCNALEGAAVDPTSGRVTLAGAHEYIASQCGAWDQQPVLKVNASAPCELRQCRAAVSSIAAPPAKTRPAPYLKWGGIAAALLALAVAVYLIARPGPQTYYTPEVLVACATPNCSQEAVARCERKRDHALNKCDLRVVRGKCEMGAPQSNGPLTRVHVEANAGARCMVKCLCR